jgi:hypothetical protein
MNRAVTKIRRPGTEFSNWREYRQALQQRGSVIVRVTPEVLEAWAPARAGHHGRASAYSDIATKPQSCCAHFPDARSGSAGSRQNNPGPAQGSAAADNSTEEAKRTGKRRDRLQRAEDLQEWLNEKHGGKPRWSWRQLHLATDPVNSDILTTTNEADASLVGPLLVQIDDLVSGEFVSQLFGALGNQF